MFLGVRNFLIASVSSGSGMKNELRGDTRDAEKESQKEDNRGKQIQIETNGSRKFIRKQAEEFQTKQLAYRVDIMKILEEAAIHLAI